MIEVEIPITYESSDINKLYDLWIEKCNDKSLIKTLSSKSLFETILKTKGKIELNNNQGKYIFQLTKGEQD